MAPQRLDPAADRLLRGFARIGAVAVAALGFLLRIRTGRRAMAAANRRLVTLTSGPARRHATLDRVAAQAAQLANSPTFDRLANRAAAWLDRLVGRILR